METIAWTIFAVIYAQNCLLLVDVQNNVLDTKFRLLLTHNTNVDTCSTCIVYFLFNTHKIKKSCFVVLFSLFTQVSHKGRKNVQSLTDTHYSQRSSCCHNSSVLSKFLYEEYITGY